MRDPRTADQLKEEIERQLNRPCFVEIRADPKIEWSAFVMSNPMRAHELQQQADSLARELRAKYILIISRATAQDIIRKELKHPSAFVQVIGTATDNFRVEVRNASSETQKAAEQIFAELRKIYHIE